MNLEPTQHHDHEEEEQQELENVEKEKAKNNMIKALTAIVLVAVFGVIIFVYALQKTTKDLTERNQELEQQLAEYQEAEDEDSPLIDVEAIRKEREEKQAEEETEGSEEETQEKEPEEEATEETPDPAPSNEEVDVKTNKDEYTKVISDMLKAYYNSTPETYGKKAERTKPFLTQECFDRVFAEEVGLDDMYVVNEILDIKLFEGKQSGDYLTVMAQVTMESSYMDEEYDPSDEFIEIKYHVKEKKIEDFYNIGRGFNTYTDE